jgi:hypothetical protein
MAKFAIIDKVIELIVGLAMIAYGLFNAGGVMNVWAGVNTTNFSSISFIFTTLGPLIVGFTVLLYVVSGFRTAH